MNQIAPPARAQGAWKKINLAELLLGFGSILASLALNVIAGIRLTPSIAATALLAVALSVSIWRYGKNR